MCNSIRLPEGVIPKARNGDAVEFMVSGTLEEDDNGARYVSLETADGEEVPEYEDDPRGMDAEDALTIFVGKLKKKKDD